MALKTPLLTVDIIIEHPDGIVLIERKNEPLGWALPGGFVDEGETVEQAAVREAKEETGLNITITRQFHVYSDPKRDPRGHTVSVVFLAVGTGEIKAASDAKEAKCFQKGDLPNLAFDHPEILEDYFSKRY